MTHPCTCTPPGTCVSELSAPTGEPDTVRQPSWGFDVPVPMLMAYTHTWWVPGAAGTVTE